MRATSKSLAGCKWPAGRVLDAPGLYRHFVSIGSFLSPSYLFIVTFAAILFTLKGFASFLNLFAI